MANGVALGLAVILFLVIIFDKPAVTSQRISCIPNPLLRKFTVYLELIPNVNLIPVAGVPNNFGTIFAVVDVPVRQGVRTDSTLIGRSGGILTVSSINATSFTSSVSILFENGAYNGSTMEFQGMLQSGPSGRFGELAVKGGTKCFRLVSGYAVSSTILGDPATNNNFINQVDISLKYDFF